MSRYARAEVVEDARRRGVPVPMSMEPLVVARHCGGINCGHAHGDAA